MKIIVVDDAKLVALSLKTILESTDDLTVAAMGSSGQEAIALYDEYKPDAVLMDIRMEGMTALEAGEEILRRHPEAKILYLTTFSDDEYIVRALTIGAKGYILKQDFEGIAPALRTVHNGQSVFGNKVMDKLPVLMKPKTEFDYESLGISEKEKEIIELVAKGYSNKEIAAELFLGEGTVRNYLSNILHQLDIRDRTNLAIFYLNEKNK